MTRPSRKRSRSSLKRSSARVPSGSTVRATLVTGFLGGVEVGIGVLVYLGILYQTGDQLLAGLGFSIGLIALLLAHSELFTENFLLPIAALVAREGTWLDLAKLWGGTLLSNLSWQKRWRWSDDWCRWRCGC